MADGRGKGDVLDPSTVQLARDVGGWIFATVVIAGGATTIIRWLMRLLERQISANEKLADSVDSLTQEIRAGARRR